MTFVRTVLGDVDPAELGVTYAHEHLVIDGGRMVEMSPDFLLDDVDRLTTELRDAAACGLATAIDALPVDCGRNPSKLAAMSRASGVRIVAATGLHHEKFYRPSHWSLRATEEELTDLFVADVEVGIDERDYGGPIVRRTEIRAGIVKVGGSEGGPSARDLPIFRAAAAAHRPDRRPDPHSLRGWDRSARADPRAHRRRRPGRADLAEPRRQGRRHGLPPRGPGDRRLRRLRPGVPLG